MDSILTEKLSAQYTLIRSADSILARKALTIHSEPDRTD